MDNSAVKYGVFAGVVVSVLILIFYFVSPQLVVDWKVSTSMLVVVAIFMIMAAREEKAANEGILPYKAALKTTFLTYVIYAVIFMIFYYILFNFIGTDLEDIQREKAMEMMDNVTKSMSEEQRDAMFERMEQQGFGLGIGKAVMSLAMSLVIGFIVALIVSLIVKKNPETA